MNAPPDQLAEPDWGTVPEPDPTAEHFKWGWNRETGEATVWAVAGGADGRPSHRDQLEAEWGRAPRFAEGDVLGIASWQPPNLSIHAYYGAHIPSEVIGWFRSAYPDAKLGFTSS